MTGSVPVVDPVRLHRQMRDGRSAHLIDVRSLAEYADGHAAGACSIPIDELDATRLKYRLGDDAGSVEPVNLICTSGLRAQQAARKLQAQGLQNVALA